MGMLKAASEECFTLAAFVVCSSNYSFQYIC